MDQTRQPTLDPGIFERNLSALRRVDASLAERLCEPIDAVKTGRTFSPEFTRDGRLNFRLIDPDGNASWFGRTSIPTVRAEAILEQFQAGHANILLPGIGEGTEAELLLRRLSTHRAVFVWEESELAIQLALRLHDYEQVIGDERLVPVVCPIERLTEELVDWLAHHPGHICPERILMWPWQEFGDLVPCRSAVEAAYQETERRRQSELDRLREQLNNRIAHQASAQPDIRSPQLVLLALHAQDETWELTRALANASAQLEWQAMELIVRKPADVHSLARLRKLVNDLSAAPDFAVIFDLTRNEVGEVLPASVPVVSWFGPQAAVDGSLAGRLRDGDPIAVCNTRILEQISTAGIDTGRITVIPPPCLVTADEDWIEGLERPIDVAIVGDLGPTDPVSFGYRLPTQMQIWKTAVDLLTAEIETFTEGRAELVLGRAEARLNTRIGDGQIREEMVHQLGGPVANTLLMRFLATALQQAGLVCAQLGDGWDTDQPAITPPLRRVIANVLKTLRRAKTIVHADVAGTVPLHALLAAGNGAVLLARSHPRDPERGGLSTLLEPDREMRMFTHAPQLVEILRHLLGHETDRRHIARQAWERCRSDHTPAERLQALRALATATCPASPI